MEYNNENLLELLDYIDPALLDYTEWTGIGMALKDAGYKASDWDAWSRRDLKRYHPGECERKWDTFTGTGITAGTLVKMALDNGYKPAKADHELDWNDTIDRHDEFVVVDKNWIEAQDIHEPEKWKPAAELIRYLETLFDSTDTVGYVTESWEKDGKYMPKSGSYTQTAGELCSALYKCGDDLGAVLGDYNPAVGAWIRFNPLDGKGVKNENITEYRYALVESDSMDIASQNAVIRELELPVACLVYSGGKSLHAIVRVDAGSYEEYRARVDYLYKVCAKTDWTSISRTAILHDFRACPAWCAESTSSFWSIRTSAKARLKNGATGLRASTTICRTKKTFQHSLTTCRRLRRRLLKACCGKGIRCS